VADRSEFTGSGTGDPLERRTGRITTARASVAKIWSDMLPVGSAAMFKNHGAAFKHTRWKMVESAAWAHAVPREWRVAEEEAGQRPAVRAAAPASGHQVDEGKRRCSPGFEASMMSISRSRVCRHPHPSGRRKQAALCLVLMHWGSGFFEGATTTTFFGLQ